MEADRDRPTASQADTGNGPPGTPVDFGEWLRARSDSPQPPLDGAKKDRQHTTVDLVLGVISGGLALVALIGWFFPPFHPVRVLLLYAFGAGAALAGFLGLYALAFSILKFIEIRAKVSLPLVLAGMLLGTSGILIDGRERALEQDAARRGKSVPNVERARARGWL